MFRDTLGHHLGANNCIKHSQIFYTIVFSLMTVQ